MKGLNVKRLQEMELFLYVTVTPMQREGSPLDKVMFTDRLSQGSAVAQIAGRPMNGDKIIDDYERTWRAKDWFQKRAPASLGQSAAPAEGVPADANALLKEMQGFEKSLPASELRRGIECGQTQQPSLSALTASS